MYKCPKCGYIQDKPDKRKITSVINGKKSKGRPPLYIDNGDGTFTGPDNLTYERIGNTRNYRILPKEQQEYIKAAAKFEREHNTFFEENEIHCDYVHCNAGMGMAGLRKCFNKGNGKPDCPKFVDEQKWLESKGLTES